MAIKRNPVAQYFANIWQAVNTTRKGMCVTIGYFFRKPITELYPEQKPFVPEDGRGLHVYDEDKCIACKMCMTACPVDCLVIEWEGRGKDALITRYEIDYQRCLFCNLCCEPCPTDCINMTAKWDLSGYTREDCVVKFDREKSEEEIAKFKEEFERQEAERKQKAAEARAKKAAADKEKKEAEAQAEQAENKDDEAAKE